MMHKEPAIDTVLAVMYRKVTEKARVILAGDGDPLVNASRVAALLRQWEKARDALGKLDDMV